ncbi:MAG TPA: type I restriction enzyme HsdR N-terminal domain-containing protein [Halococcus sp.]|nr:type I restriction enzyme HsdR N-terminal domain-containing protein [Halococcus sp.]
MDESAVKEYVDQSRSILEASPQMSEENTKVRLIQPFIELLGWNIYSTEVELEYPVRIATRQTKVDYALLVGDTPVVFIEAKPSGSDLSDDSVGQLRSYLRQELDVDWGIVTNGKSFEVLSKSGNSGSREEVSIAKFDIDDLEENPELLEILSKEAIESGKSDEIAEQIARTNQAVQHLRENGDQVARQLTDVLESEISDGTPIDLEEQSANFVDELISALQERRRFIGDSSSSTSKSVSATDTGDSGTEHGGLQLKRNSVTGTIARSDIQGNSESAVAVFPAHEASLAFLKENNGWGFVRVGRDFECVAMYVVGDSSEVSYFATVEKIVEPEDVEFVRPLRSYRDDAKIAEGKKFIKFEPNSLYELENPIPYETKSPQSRRYTTLDEFRKATTTDDIL